MNQETIKLTREQYNELKKELDTQNLELVENQKIIRFMIMKDRLTSDVKHMRVIPVKHKNGSHALNAGQLEYLKKFNVKYSKSVDFNYIEFEAIV